MNLIKLKPDVKTAWLAALRSGEYEQTTGSLISGGITGCSNPRYCCMGVLCELSAVARIEWNTLGLPPMNVAEWALENPSNTWAIELDEPDRDSAATVDGIPYSFISNLNDRNGLTFPQIADMIERFAQCPK